MALSESSVGPHLEEVFAGCDGRIVVTCFASNIHRVQQVVDAAESTGRKVALIGRSMRKNVNIGRNLGTSTSPRACSSGWRGDRGLPRPQGRDHLDREPGRAAFRAAADGARRPPDVELHQGDTVIFSATPIPGNERAVNETIDRIYQVGADVITTARRADPRLGATGTPRSSS